MSDEQQDRGLYRQHYKGPNGNDVIALVDRYGRILGSVCVPDRARMKSVENSLSMLLNDLDPGPAESGSEPSGKGSQKSGSGDQGEFDTRVGCLVLDREGEYSDTGTRFRVWRFTEDRPDIPARERAVSDPTGRRRSVDGPPHAVEGDKLWEKPDSLTPWKLKRDGVRIGSPEHWQVRDAFGGELPPWGDLEGHDGQGGGEEPGDGPDPYRYVSREKRCGDPFDGEANWAPEDRHGLYRFKRPVPPIGAEAGDLLVYAFKPSSRPTMMRGHARGLEPDEIEDLRKFIREEESPALIESVPAFFESLLGGEENLIGEKREWGWQKQGLLDFLHAANKWGRRLSDFYPRLFLLKPALEKVSDPIEAPTDEGAIFKLLHQTGGKMPNDS